MVAEVGEIDKADTFSDHSLPFESGNRQALLGVFTFICCFFLYD